MVSCCRNMLCQKNEKDVFASLKAHLGRSIVQKFLLESNYIVIDETRYNQEGSISILPFCLFRLCSKLVVRSLCGCRPAGSLRFCVCSLQALQLLQRNSPRSRLRIQVQRYVRFLLQTDHFLKYCNRRYGIESPFFK